MPEMIDNRRIATLFMKILPEPTEGEKNILGEEPGEMIPVEVRVNGIEVSFTRLWETIDQSIEDEIEARLQSMIPFKVAANLEKIDEATRAYLAVLDSK